MNRETFLNSYPSSFFLDATRTDELTSYLGGREWLSPGESILGVEKAGEGNMNCTLRVRTETRSLILKQARPWVEKYPQIAAPVGRAELEARVYQELQKASEAGGWAGCMARLLDFDAGSYLLVLEDLGEAPDYLTLYRKGARLDSNEVKRLATILGKQHQVVPAEPGGFRNRAMRELNHEHIFKLPLQNGNGLDLDQFCPGLAAEAKGVLNDERFIARAEELGEYYLADGAVLLHGDYYPGSWVRSTGGAKVLDFEFAFCGEPAFDVGVCLAHLMLSEQPNEIQDSFLSEYELAVGRRLENFRLAWQFAGVEIMRRLIGVAQLPLEMDASERGQLLERARELVLKR